MEKRKPHYSLNKVKCLVKQGLWHMTKVAQITSMGDFGMELEQVGRTLCRLNSRNFYKSMTTYADSRQWQDVYHPVINGTPAYLKISIDGSGLLVVSLKKKDA